MKQSILFTLAAALLINTYANAQSWQAAVGLGIVTNTVPAQTTQGNSTISGVYGIDVSRTFSRIELGIGLKCLPLVSETDTHIGYNSAGQIVESNYSIYYAKKALVIAPFLNYRFLTGDNVLYAGINAGIAPTFAGPKENLALYSNNGVSPANEQFSYDGGIGFTAGAQAGYRRALSSHISLGAGFGCNFFSGTFTQQFSGASSKERINIFYFTGMIGINYCW